ncbi:MAG: hypothetical protein H6702_00935 [Myxococcales bacterium]|nr:hypothetical protein [Myxococcales bacterium]
MLVSLLSALLGLLAPPLRLTPPPAEAPAAVARAWAALGPPHAWPTAPLAPDGPDHARLDTTPQGPAIVLYRPRHGRVIRQPLRLPGGATEAALAEALRLQIEFLRDSPSQAGEPWKQRPAGPPPITADPPWPADLAHELERPGLRFPEPPGSGIPPPPAAPAPSKPTTVVEQVGSPTPPGAGDAPN